MTLETNVPPAEETQNPSAELTQDNPEVVAPETVETEGAPPQEPESSPEDDKEKALKRMQRRIDRRTADLYQTRAEAEQLRQRLAQLEQPPEEGTPRQADPHHLAREIASVERFTEKCNAVAKDGAKKFTDFDASLKSLAAETGPLFDAHGRPGDLMKVVMESDAPDALLYHLGKNPDVAADLVDLTPTQLARRLDRFEREMTQAAKPKVSSAPKPLKPVAGGGASVKDPSQMTDAEFRAWRLAQK